MPRRAQSSLLVQEVMEEEWSALQSVDSCPEGLSQVRLGYVFLGRVLRHQEGPVSPSPPNPSTLQPPVRIPAALNPGSSIFKVRLF